MSDDETSSKLSASIFTGRLHRALRDEDLLRCDVSKSQSILSVKIVTASLPWTASSSLVLPWYNNCTAEVKYLLLLEQDSTMSMKGTNIVSEPV